MVLDSYWFRIISKKMIAPSERQLLLDHFFKKQTWRTKTSGYRYGLQSHMLAKGGEPKCKQLVVYLVLNQRKNVGLSALKWRAR